MTASELVICERSAKPFAIGTAPPTMPDVAITPMRGSDRCMIPPLPLHVPPTRPMISAITSPTGAPLARVSCMPR